MKIIASDLNPKYLERADNGIYPLSSLKEVSRELLSIYFEPVQSEALYKIKPFLKKDILWKQNHLLSDPPSKDFHVVFLRNNLLTYYLEKSSVRALKKIIESLLPLGFLIIGVQEKLPIETKHLTPYAGFSYILRKNFRAIGENGGISYR